MAAPSRRPGTSLIEALRAAPECYDFIQAVRLLERAAEAAARRGQRPKPTPIGSEGGPRGEAVRLRATLDLAFPATEVTRLETAGDATEVSTAVMGLTGVSGVLPDHYSRLVLESCRDKNTALRDFLDLFNHRALSLLVRAAEKYRLPLAFERSRGDRDDAISGALLALIGLRGTALRRRQAVADETLAYYAGHFAHQPRTADALRQMLSEHFEQRVEVRQFQGHWVTLQTAEQTRLGGRSAESRRYAALGVSAITGSQVWDVQGSFRILLGPLDYSEFQKFIPGAASMAELSALTQSYVGAALRFDVQVTLKAAQIPPLVLSMSPPGARLGWNTWLPSQGPREDAKDAIFSVDAIK